MSIWRWADWLDSVPESHRVTLGEGNTPVVRSRRIGPSTGLHNLFFKLETSNPTSSYKDRFAVTAISHMKAAGKTRCVATSSGNTGSALAAYCAAAGIECLIAIVEAAPEGKLQQMLAYGAKLYRVRGFGTDPTISADTFRVIEQLGAQPGSAIQISAYLYSPKGMSGVKTLSYELAEQCPQLDHVFCQAGGGGMVLAVARGFDDLLREGRLSTSPRIECVQPEGNDTIASPLRRGDAEAQTVHCTTKISGLQVPNVLDGTLTLQACRSSGGTGHVVTDEEVWIAQSRLAREEGIFCEPAAATSLAGALKAAQQGLIAPDAHTVCFITGSGFKDPPSVQRMLAGTSCPVVDLAEFRRLL